MALPGVLARQELVGVDSDLMNDVRSLERLTLNAAIGAVDLRTLSRRRVALRAGTGAVWRLGTGSHFDLIGMPAGS